MTDDEIVILDWSLAKTAAREHQSACDRPALRARETPRRRSHGPIKRAPGVNHSPEQLAFDFSETVVRLLRLPAVPEAIAPSTSPKPRASFIPFPLGRRRKLVNLLAGQMGAASTGEAAEKLFQGRAARLARGLRRKRVPEQVIERELRALEAAVRTALRCVVFDPAAAGKKSDGG